VNILGGKGYVTIVNPSATNRTDTLPTSAAVSLRRRSNLIGVSAGFDHHVEDWGGLLTTEDYQEMGRMIREAAEKNGGGCFAILEGGYNHRVSARMSWHS